MWFFHFSWLKSKGDLVNWWDLTRMVEIKRMVEKGRTENGNDSFVAFLSVPPNKSWTWRGIKYFFMKWWWWWIWNGGYSSSFLLFFFFFCPFWAQHFVSTAWAFNSRPWQAGSEYFRIGHVNKVCDVFYKMGINAMMQCTETGWFITDRSSYGIKSNYRNWFVRKMCWVVKRLPLWEFFFSSLS